MAFQNLWTVINLDPSITESTIRGWIGSAGIPSCIHFVFQTPFDNMWVYKTSNNSTVPFPVSPNTIIISSQSDSRFIWNIGGIAVRELYQASIGHWSYDTPGEAGARMWHEIIHCYRTPTGSYIPADDMLSNERAGFTEYLRTSGSAHYPGFANDASGYSSGSNHTAILVEYYAYLVNTYLGCDCYGIGCNVTPEVVIPEVVTPEVVTPEVVTPEVVVTPQNPLYVLYEDAGNGNNKNLYIAAGVLLLIFLTR